MTRFRPLIVLISLCLCVVVVSRSSAYVEAPHSLGAVISQSTNIMVCVVEKVDKEKNLVIFRKTEDLKGKHPTDMVRHNIGKGGFHPREWQYIMEWAEVGKTAIFFHNGGAGEMCLGTYWYQIYPGGDWWNMSHGEPFLLRSFAGKAEKLIPILKDMLAGKETIAPCMVDGNKDDLHQKRAKIQRLKVSLKLQDYNPKRDFAGWGGEDIRALKGMPGFTHIAALTRVDPEAQAVSVCDFDGDGKPDICLAGAGKVVLLQNGGDSYSEISLPGVTGCRSAVWADYNGDGKPDLLLATSAGPKLFTNLGGGQFRDDSALLPSESSWNLTAAAWMDYDGDGKPDILLANGYHGLRLYRNNPPKDLAQKLTPPKFGEWYWVGPFDNAGRKGFATAYPPEKETFNPFATFDGKNKAKVKWNKANLPDGNIHNLKAIVGGHDDACCYLYREIEAASPTEIPCSFGSDDTLTVWCNGERLINENVDRAAAPDQSFATLKLKPGKNALLIKICQGWGEWAYYFKPGEAKVNASGWFQDVSKQAGLGEDGVAGDLKGDALAVADVDGDGRPDFLYSAGNGVLVMNTKDGFYRAKETGISFKAGKVGPCFIDLNRDGRPDLFVPQDGGCKLFRNVGGGKFNEVSATTGDLARPIGRAVCAAWGDFDNDGHIDLMVGCLGGSNRFFRNRGDGTYEDRSDAVGLTQKRFNSQAIALVDLNNDGMLDAIFVNEGQESCLLLGSPSYTGGGPRRAAVTVHLGKNLSAVGSRAVVKSADGTPVAAQQLNGGDGRGSQRLSGARFTLPPGNYVVQVRDSKGAVAEKNFVVAEQPLKVLVE